MGNPLYTRQALYFLSEVDCVIKGLFNEDDDADKQSRERTFDRFRQIADDCLFAYSLCRPDSRITARSDAEIHCRYAHERVYSKWTDAQGHHHKYLEVDGSHASVVVPLGESVFEEAFRGYQDRAGTLEIRLSELGEYELRMNALFSDVPIARFREVPYTFHELALLSDLYPLDPRIWGRGSTQAPSKALTDEIMVGMYNQPYLAEICAFPSDKWPVQEIFAVSQTYGPHLLDF
jgi:hypothetical protein